MSPKRLSNPEQIKNQLPPNLGILSEGAINLFLLLCPLFRKNGDYLQLSIPELAAALGVSEKSAWSYKKELESADILFKKRYTDGPNTYWLNPLFFRKKSWYDYLKDWCDIIPDFKYTLTSVAMLLSVSLTQTYEPIVNLKLTPSFSSNSLEQIRSLDTQEIQKEEQFGGPPGVERGSVALESKGRIVDEKTDDIKVVRLVEKICERLSELGVVLDIRDEADLYSYSYNELVAACKDLNEITGPVEDWKTFFRASLKKAKETVPAQDITWIASICNYLRSRGAKITEEIIAEMHAFPATALSSGLTAVMQDPVSKFPLALFFEHARKSCISTGKLPDYGKRDAVIGKSGALIRWLPQGSVYGKEPFEDPIYPAEMLFERFYDATLNKKEREEKSKFIKALSEELDNDQSYKEWETLVGQTWKEDEETYV